MFGLGLPGPGAQIAVAVSGGSDSLALTFLASDWAQRQGLTLVALTVDHKLRPESAAEARQVGDWLRRHGIRHEILQWQGRKPATGLQAAAREARYDLMTVWAAQNGVREILTAHHLEDQAETFLLRASRGSGLDGLAAMAPVTGWNQIRILRPLLTVPRHRLRAILTARHQPWIEDPSNQDDRFARVVMRRLLQRLEQHGAPAVRIAALAGNFGRLRDQLGAATAEAIAGCCHLHAEGYVSLQPGRFERYPRPLRERVLAGLIRAVGGNIYPARRNSIARLAGRMVNGGDFSGATLGGCRIMPWRSMLLVCREQRNLGPRMPLKSGTWHRIFAFEFEAGPALDGNGYEIGPLGVAGWRQIKQDIEPDRRRMLPSPVRPTLPALFDAEGVFWVPHLGYNSSKRKMAAPRLKGLRFVAFDGVALTTDCLASPLELTICNSQEAASRARTGGPLARSRSKGSCRISGQERIEN